MHFFKQKHHDSILQTLVMRTLATEQTKWILISIGKERN